MKIFSSLERAKEITILCGSESDLSVATSVAARISSSLACITVHIISCHRNIGELIDFAELECKSQDAIIAIGSKAFALPGMIDTMLYKLGKNIPVIGVALGRKNSRVLQAAILSIEELPGSPVIMDENEICYQGRDGLRRAIDRIVNGNLPPPKNRIQKPAQMNVFKNF